jgi:hypothetical protein
LCLEFRKFLAKYLKKDAEELELKMSPLETFEKNTKGFNFGEGVKILIQNLLRLHSFALSSNCAAAFAYESLLS